MSLTIGAVRWDACYANGGMSHRCLQNDMSQAAFQHRSPWWTERVSSNVIALNGTQETMDAEINLAADNGVDYWAFLLYPAEYFGPNNATARSRALYESSTINSRVKWAQMRQGSDWGSTGSYAAKVAIAAAQALQSNYQRVLTNRPLVFVFNAYESLDAFWGGSYVNFKAAIDSFRSVVQAGGAGDPYMVSISTLNAAQAVTDKTGLGLDAATMYAVGTQTVPRQPYSTLATHIEGTTWPILLASGGMLPMCSQGWDRRPRIERPVEWELSVQRPYFGRDLYTVPPTPSEFQAHVEAGISYISANPAECSSQSLLISTWSEFDEGGGICPTIGDPSGQLLQAVLAARS